MKARNRNGRLLQGISLTALAGGLAISTPALAQDAPATTPAPNAATPTPAQSAADDPNTIIVTAQFREQRLQDTPLSITAVTGETIEARGQTTLADMGAYAPNVTLRETPATYGPAVAAYIRGVGQRDTTFALEPGVGLYIDDVYYPTLQG